MQPKMDAPLQRQPGPLSPASLPADTQAEGLSEPALQSDLQSAADDTHPYTADSGAVTRSVQAVQPILAEPADRGRFFHHYEVCLRDDGTTLFELGRGAMGVSYKARDVNLDVLVAIKVINASLPSQSQARERFRREARAAAQLRHPNVASVFHFGETESGQCFYAMEFVDGETLAAHVKRLGPLPVPLALDITLQVAAALIAADERGVVHRDLKPANIMLAPAQARTRLTSRQGGTASSFPSRVGQMAVKVIDFGLAKAVSSAADTMEDSAPLTQVGFFLGTPAYASPEQAEGREVDARSDIYSLGVVLWFLLTAKVPFAGRSFNEIHDRQLHRSLPLAQLADLKVPPGLTELLKSMLAPIPAKRPASPSALYEALERCRDEENYPPPENVYQPAPRSARKTRLAAALALGALITGAAAFLFFSNRVSAPAAKPATVSVPAPRDKSIAVLPLEDLSEDKTNAYFADGIQDDLLSSLTKIKDLKVISRSSVMVYRSLASRNLRQIGEQLGVSTILEGSVRRGPDRVLVNVALTDTRTSQQIWGDHYDRTIADSLTLQGELATEIAAALQATLSPEEKARVEVRPTDNADAYVLYLRARDYQTRPFTLLQDLQTAEKLYRQAVALDPKFALASARLSATLAYHYLTFEPTIDIRDQARAAADESLRLQPDLGEAHLARVLGLYWTEKNYDAALRELAVAGRLLPGSAEIDLFTGAIRRRQGYWTQGIASMRKALVRDPRSAQTAREIMYSTCMLRDWRAGARDGERAVALAPDNPMVLIEKGHIAFWAAGDLRPLSAAAANAPVGSDPDGQLTLARCDAALLGQDYAAAQRAVANCPLESVVTTFGAVLPKDYLLGSIALAEGKTARAKALFQSACPTMEAEARKVPLDPFRQAYLGLAYAFLGRSEDALRQGERAVELLPESKDACAAPIPAGLLALIYAQTGKSDQAIALIERLLTTPAALSPVFDGSITINDLRTRWQWDPLRADPRFRALLAAPEPKTVYR